MQASCQPLSLIQHNTGQLNSTDIGRDLNVERVWLQGTTGCDSVVAIVDDGKKDKKKNLRNESFYFYRRGVHPQ